MKKVLFSEKPNGIRAVGIVIYQEKVLLMRREKRGKKYFTFPGGGVEEGETVEQAVVRELAEECSVTVATEKLLYHHDLIQDSDQYFYKCRYISGDVKLGGEELEKNRPGNIYEPMWFLIKNIPQITLYPLEVRDWVYKDAKNNFQEDLRRIRLAVNELRQ